MTRLRRLHFVFDSKPEDSNVVGEDPVRLSLKHAFAGAGSAPAQLLALMAFLAA